MVETSIGGYEVLGKLGDSKRFKAFQASSSASEGARRGTLYLMTDGVEDPDLFIDTAEAIRDAWPFADGSQRDYVLPKAQLWEGRPWFFLPELLPVVASVDVLGRAAFESLTAQLRWLEHFQPAGGERRFAHGDVRKERIALFDEDQALLIAPGWVAAADYARGQGLSRVRGDDVWHLGQLWIRASDHSFVPEGMEPELSEAVRRLPRSRPSPRVEARESLRADAATVESAPAQPTSSAISSDTLRRSPALPSPAASLPAAPSPPPPLAAAAKASNGARPAASVDRAPAPPLASPSAARPTPVALAAAAPRLTPVGIPAQAAPAAPPALPPQRTTPALPATEPSLPAASPKLATPAAPGAAPPKPATSAAPAKLATSAAPAKPATPPAKLLELVAVPTPAALPPTPPATPSAPPVARPAAELASPVEAPAALAASPEPVPAPPAASQGMLKVVLIAAILAIAVALAIAFFK